MYATVFIMPLSIFIIFSILPELGVWSIPIIVNIIMFNISFWFVHTKNKKQILIGYGVLYMVNFAFVAVLWLLEQLFSSFGAPN